MTEMPNIALSDGEAAAKDWLARRFVTFGEELARLLLHFGFEAQQALLMARLLVGEIVETGMQGRRLDLAVEAVKTEPPPPAMPSGGQLALLIPDVQISAWVKDRRGAIESRVRIATLGAAQTTTLGLALLHADPVFGERPVFDKDGTTVGLAGLDNGVYLDAPAMGGEFAGLRQAEFRSLILLRTDRHVSHLGKDGVALVRLAAAVPVDRRLVGVVKFPAVEAPSALPQGPRIDRRV